MAFLPDTEYRKFTAFDDESKPKTMSPNNNEEQPQPSEKVRLVVFTLLGVLNLWVWLSGNGGLLTGIFGAGFLSAAILFAWNMLKRKSE